MRVFILFLLLILPLSAFTGQSTDDGVVAGDGRICAPFRGGIVDPVIIKSMLRASQDGRLYRIQPKGSIVGFCVDSAAGRVEARFKGVQGGLALRREVWGDQSQMLVMIDTNSLAMDRAYLKNLLESESFLDTYTYSKILFVSTKFWWLSNEKAVLEGRLTMHGVTKPVFFSVHMATVPNSNPDSVADIVITAKSFIRRTDFDMDNLLFLVSEEIELCMRIEASLFRK